MTAQVESFVSGNIKSWSCDYNTIVKIGQICALIDPLPFQVIVDQDTAAKLDEPALARIRGRRIGFVFQTFNLLPRTSAIENVELPLFYAAQIEGNIARARHMLHMLGLADRERNQPNQLSGGQQQRVAIARALVNNPAIVLADEPTGNLDSLNALDIMATIRALNLERGVTVVLVTHERDLAELADRIITLRDGQIISDSPTAQSVARGATRTLPAVQPYRERRFASRFDSLLNEAGSVGWIAVQAALRAIGRNKLRAGLTMLGMFIGVAALIAMVAVGEGARAAVEAQVQSLGTDLLVVLPGTTRVNGVRAGNGSAASLRVKDVGEILEEDPAVADVSCAAAASMTRHIVSLGHERIGFIKGAPDQPSSELRFAGYKLALAEAKIPLVKSLVRQGHYTYRSGLKAAEQLLTMANPPTAIFASNDDMASATVAVAHRHHLNVPNDLTVCGFDDTELSRTIWPELTTVRQPIADMSRAGLLLLIKKIMSRRKGYDDVAESTLMEFSLVFRDSAGQAR